MFIRRHFAFYMGIFGARDAQKATIRLALDWGISQTNVSKAIGCHRNTVWSVASGGRYAYTRLQYAREQVARAQHALRLAEGRERAALARLTEGKV